MFRRCLLSIGISWLGSSLEEVMEGGSGGVGAEEDKGCQRVRRRTAIYALEGVEVSLPRGNPTTTTVVQGEGYHGHLPKEVTEQEARSPAIAVGEGVDQQKLGEKYRPEEEHRLGLVLHGDVLEFCRTLVDKTK